ncbi:hypothetical protein [Merismopedia glauca]|nr:hypothetical protein [Merismopedia glauca]
MNTSELTLKPQDLTESRLQLHYAVQFIAAVGKALVPPKPDESHVSLGWNPQLNYFVSEIIPAAKPFQVALDLVTLTSLILDRKGNQIAEFPLDQKTLAEGINWLKGEINKLGAEAQKIALIDYPSDFPDSPLARGAVFDATQEPQRRELMGYYADTYLLLQDILATTQGSSPVHTWPHHFDMATLITLPGMHDGEPMTIGVGFSPGDTSYNEPYWYVTPWPYPETTNLPALEGGGFWHTENWVGAVLKAFEIKDKKVQIRDFLNSAVKAAQFLLQSVDRLD